MDKMYYVVEDGKRLGVKNVHKLREDLYIFLYNHDNTMGSAKEVFEMGAPEQNPQQETAQKSEFVPSELFERMVKHINANDNKYVSAINELEARISKLEAEQKEKEGTPTKPVGVEELAESVKPFVEKLMKSLKNL